MLLKRLPKNNECIGYKCVKCNKKIYKKERQKIIQLKCSQNLCMLCLINECIGYRCVECNKNIDELERQKIIQLKCFQTWCMLCLSKKYPYLPQTLVEIAL